MFSPLPSKRSWLDAVGSIYFIGGIESEETYPYHGKKKGKRCYFDESQIVAYDMWTLV